MAGTWNGWRSASSPSAFAAGCPPPTCSPASTLPCPGDRWRARCWSWRAMESLMWKGRTVSLVLPTYNEKDSIRTVIQDFEALGLLDEIIVVNNNAAAGTSEEVARTGAREVREPVQGYGAAIRRGFQESKGDLVAVCEADDTFAARDIFKLLAYSEDMAIVYGSRTVTEFIWAGANMGRFLKWGNWATAKLMEALFNTNSLTDVGCTYRIIRRDALERLEPHFRVRSN